MDAHVHLRDILNLNHQAVQKFRIEEVMQSGSASIHVIANHGWQAQEMSVKITETSNTPWKCSKRRDERWRLWIFVYMKSTDAGKQ